ncbi:MAG: PDZ domain-containing protein, partial [bacterium]
MNRQLTRTGQILFAILFILAPILLANCRPQGPHSRASEHEQHGWLGVYVQDLDEDLRRYLDIEERHGVLINDVAEDSPAEDAGLREEDVIIRFDGKRIRNSKELSRAIRSKEPGDRVKIEIIRDGKRKKIALRIAERPRRFYSRYDREPRSFYFPFRRYRRPWLGVHMAELNQDLAEYFNVNERDGVLILSVEEDSPAEDSGLKAGDVMTQIDDKKIRDTEDVEDIIQDKDVGDEVEIKIIRRGNEQTVKVELGKAPRSYSWYWDRDQVQYWKEEMKNWK